MTTRALLLLGITLATPAVALEIAPDCYALVGGEKTGFYAQDIGRGFVTYAVTRLPPGPTIVVLEHCASTDRMTAQWSGKAFEQDAAIWTQFDAMVEGEARYTLPQIADALQAAGATASVLRTGMESCACQLLAAGRLGQGAYQPDVLP